jgi:hypothetical protein
MMNREDESGLALLIVEDVEETHNIIEKWN